ncbi:hypothetical protein ERO13_A08G041466v2 [Gossypium hirsutum]|uniref:Uncharacterized protein n=1 Tax=Gossypium barbadense TaxID=3634 RepID=A0A5J5UPM3_GOSBA|nr:hypothetical protein ES319_A08G047200v1 [Gossypium barbadense]KAG4186389.1 hypothetical protein ERO13_A08G041466v2 [Gossypium hirsutum]
MFHKKKRSPFSLSLSPFSSAAGFRGRTRRGKVHGRWR